MNEIKVKPKLLLVDGHSLAFRSFYAFSKGGEGGLMTSNGLPTSVTYGFLKSLLEICKSHSPQGVAIAFDTAEPTFRHIADPNYKANRDVAPEIFFQDLDQLQEILQNELALPIFKAPGYEADDVLGTLANLSAKQGWIVRILSGDRDLFQLVDDQLDIAVLYMSGGPYAGKKGPILINESGVSSKLGVPPDKVVDMKALTGDSSDNIPGVKGIGPKTAINLLKENGDLDGVYTSLSLLTADDTNPKKGAIKGAVIDKLKNNKDNAYLSRKLALIDVDVPIHANVDLGLSTVNGELLKNRLDDLELKSLSIQVPSFVYSFSKGGYLSNKPQASNLTQPKKNSDDFIHSNAKSRFQRSVPDIQPTIIRNKLQLNQLIEHLSSLKDPLNPVALDTETTHINPFRAELVGLGFAWGDQQDQIAYIPIAHRKLTSQYEDNQIELEIVLSSIRPWLSDPSYPKVLQNAKYDRLIFMRHGLTLEGLVMDTLLADYVRDSGDKHSLEEMANREYKIQPLSFEKLVPKGMTFASVSIEEASRYCGMDVHLTLRLYKTLKSKLDDMGTELMDLLLKVEQPLESVLARMEATGVRIDVDYLSHLSKELKHNLNLLKTQVTEIAGVSFNLSSPKQLGELLFDKLGLDRKKSRRTKTGWSTDASVLERLESDHPLVPLILEHRVLSKLLSTYVEALPQLVEEETGRLHTDFNQAVTATGRLSSSNPNLQNIPIRTQFSKRIRRAFLPKEDWLLISADYSQIELRILAHLSGEEVLKNAFLNNEDVHSLTAKVLLDKDSVTEDERRLGKTINFGVIYGMGPQRFSKSVGVSLQEAKDFLKRYKERYKDIFSFLELQERLALSKGYVSTLLGRRRTFNFDPNGLGRLLGKDPYEIDLDIARRGGMEAQQLRAAANAPIQGSSADIIKIAMVKLDQHLHEASLEAKLLLQVHDELVLEVHPEALEQVKHVVINTMENAVKLSVPLLVETGVGSNWMDTK